MKRMMLCAGVVLAGLLAGCAEGGANGAAGQGHAGEETLAGGGTRAALGADTASEQDFRKIINGAKAKVFPAVVFIKVVQQDYTGGDKSLARDCRQRRDHHRRRAKCSPTGTSWTRRWKCAACCYDGRAFDATVLGSDKDADLAVIRLKQAAGAGKRCPSPKSAIRPNSRKGIL